MAGSRDIEAVLKIKDELSKNLQKANKNLKELNTQVKKVHKETEKVGKNTGFVNLTKSIVGAQIAMRVAAVFLREFTSGAVSAQSEQEAAINKLNLALANQGNLLPGVSKRLQEYASSLQQVTTFGDETILVGQSLLASFGMNEEQLKSTTATALDFAAATGRDLTMAINLLGKAFVGETGELSRYGVIIDSSIPKHEKFAEVMKQLNERFGGQAQAQVATFTGQLQQFENAAGDTQEALGFLIGQFLDFGSAAGTGVGVMEWIGKVFREDFVVALGLARKAFTGWVSFFLGIWEGLLGALGRMAGPLGEPFRAAAESIGNFRDGLKTAGDAMLAEAAIAANAGVQTLDFANNTDMVAGSAVNAASSVKEFEASMKELDTAIASSAKEMEGFRAEADKIADAAWDEYIAKLDEETIKNIKSTEELADAHINLLPPLGASAKGTEALAKESASLHEVMGAGVLVMGDIGNVLSVFGVEVDGTIGKITRLISSFESMFNNVSKLIGAFTGGGGGGGGLVGALGSLGGQGGGGGGGLLEMGIKGVGSLFGGNSGPPGIGSGLPSMGSFMPGMTGGVGGGGAVSGAIASGASSVMAGVSTALAAIPVVGWIALAGIGTALLARAIFGEESAFSQAGKELGNAFSEGFGESIEEGVQWHIAHAIDEARKTSSDVDVQAIIQQNLGAVIGGAVEGGEDINWDEMTAKMADTFSFLERGQITATEAQQTLNETMGWLLPELDKLGPEGEAQLLRLVTAAQAAGIEFEGMAQFVNYVESGFTSLGIAIDTSLEGLAGQLDISTAAAKELADMLGVKVKTEAQLLANELGVTPKKLQEIGEAIKEKYGIPLSGIQGLLDMMGVSIQDLATAFGIEIPAAIGNTASALGNLSIPSLPTGGGGGGGRSESEGYQAQGGLHTGILNSPFTFTAHPGESIHVDKPGNQPGGGGSTVNVTSEISLYITQPLGTSEQLKNVIGPPIKEMIEDNTGDLTDKIIRELNKQGGIN